MKEEHQEIMPAKEMGLDLTGHWNRPRGAQCPDLSSERFVYSFQLWSPAVHRGCTGSAVHTSSTGSVVHTSSTGSGVHTGCTGSAVLEVLWLPLGAECSFTSARGG